MHKSHTSITCTVPRKTQFLRYSGDIPFSFLVGAAKMLLAFVCWILGNHDEEIFWEYIATVKTLLISGSYTRMESLAFFKDTSPAVSAILGTLAFYFVGVHPNRTPLTRIITKYCCSLMHHPKVV